MHVINPVDFEFTFDIAGKKIVAPSRMADALESGELAGILRNADRAAVIVGALAESGPYAAAIRSAAAIDRQVIEVRNARKQLTGKNE